MCLDGFHQSPFFCFSNFFQLFTAFFLSTSGFKLATYGISIFSFFGPPLAKTDLYVDKEKRLFKNEDGAVKELINKALLQT